QLVMGKISGDGEVVGNDPQHDPSKEHTDVNGQCHFLEKLFEVSGEEDKKPAYHRGGKAEENGESEVEKRTDLVLREIPHGPQAEMDDEGEDHKAGTAGHKGRDDGPVVLHRVFVMQDLQRKQAASQGRSEKRGES